MTDPDPELAARLRELSEERVRAQIAAAKRQADQRKQSRQAFAERRRVGVEKRHAIKAARQNLTDRHDQKGQQP